MRRSKPPMTGIRWATRLGLASKFVHEDGARRPHPYCMNNFPLPRSRDGRTLVRGWAGSITVCDSYISAVQSDR